MTDDSQQLPPDPAQQGEDPLANLEDLLQKAKAKRVASDQTVEKVQEVPSGPTPEEIQAQQQADLAIQEEQGEALRQQQLEQQRKKMAEELQNTPEYQARKVQDQEVAEKAEEIKAAHQGHVIHQVSDDKM